MHPGGSSFKNSISLDQFAADYIGRETRFPSLVLNASVQQTLSWTRAGVPIPGATPPSQVFTKLFLSGNATEIEAQVTRLKLGESIMDTVLDQANALQKKLSGPDRHKFDEYLTAVREVEEQMHRQHLAFDPTNNAPLGKVFVSMLQRLGIEIDQFGSGKGTIAGLESSA